MAQKKLTGESAQNREQGLRHLQRLIEGLRETIRQLEGKKIILVLAGSLIQAVGICNIHAYSEVTEGGGLGLTLLIYH